MYHLDNFILNICFPFYSFSISFHYVIFLSDESSIDGSINICKTYLFSPFFFWFVRGKQIWRLLCYLLQVDGNFIDRALASKQKTGYTSVLFYASWCPFSRSLYPTFEMLSFMFPQVEHLAVEQSSAFPRCELLIWYAYVFYLCVRFLLLPWILKSEQQDM